MIKFIPKHIGFLSRPTIIVGEKPGNTRDGSTFSLVGNRTGDFVQEAIGDKTNIILTNIVNLQYPGNFDRNIGVADGIIDLIELIETHKPKKIITLGSIAREYIKSIKLDEDIVIWNMLHPSFINRFHSKLRPDYIKQLSDELD